MLFLYTVSGFWFVVTTSRCHLFCFEPIKLILYTILPIKGERVQVYGLIGLCTETIQGKEERKSSIEGEGFVRLVERFAEKDQVKY